MAELVIIDKNELKEHVKQAINEYMEDQVKESDFQQRMNRKDAAVFLGISYQCFGQWIKKGWIIEHGAGRKGYYLKSELMNLKQKIG